MTTPRTPKKLYRRLTDWVGTPVTPDHPSVTMASSGDFVRVGRRAGFALTDEQFTVAGNISDLHINKPYDARNTAFYTDGKVPVSLQQNEWYATVFCATGGAAAGAGDPVFYYDTAQGPANDDNYHLVVGNGADNADAFVGILAEDCPSIGAGAVERAAIIEIIPYYPVGIAAADFHGAVLT